MPVSLDQHAQLAQGSRRSVSKRGLNRQRSTDRISDAVRRHVSVSCFGSLGKGMLADDATSGTSAPSSERSPRVRRPTSSEMRDAWMTAQYGVPSLERRHTRGESSAGELRPRTTGGAERSSSPAERLTAQRNALMRQTSIVEVEAPALPSMSI